MKHSVAHTLDKETARQAVQQALDAYAAKLAQYEPKVNWQNPDAAKVSFSVKGFTLNGAVEVATRSIDIDLDVPFVLRPFKKKAIAIIEREIETWLQKATRGEL